MTNGAAVFYVSSVGKWFIKSASYDFSGADQIISGASFNVLVIRTY
jgi:hypothetical protein